MLSSTPTNIHKTTWYTSNIKRSELKEKKPFEYLQTLFYFSLNFLDSISHRLRLFISQSDCSSGWRIFLCPAKTKFWLNFLLIFKTCFDFSDNRKVYKRILLKQNVFVVFDRDSSRLAWISVRFHCFASNEFMLRSIDSKFVFGVPKSYRTLYQ